MIVINQATTTLVSWIKYASIAKNTLASCQTVMPATAQTHTHTHLQATSPMTPILRLFKLSSVHRSTLKVLIIQCSGSQFGATVQMCKHINQEATGAFACRLGCEMFAQLTQDDKRVRFITFYSENIPAHPSLTSSLMKCVHRPVVFNSRHTTEPLSPALVKYTLCNKSPVVELFCIGPPHRHVSMLPPRGFQHLAVGARAPKGRFPEGIAITCCYISRPAVSTDETSYEAGIKVQIHSQDEPPFIDQLGFGVAPGFQTFVSCQQQLVSNVQPPPLLPWFFFSFPQVASFYVGLPNPRQIAFRKIWLFDSGLSGCCDCTVKWQTEFQFSRDAEKMKLHCRAKWLLDALQYSQCFSQIKKTPPTLNIWQHRVYFHSLYF